MKTSQLLTTLSFIALAACGGGGKDPGTVNTANATASVNSVGDVSAAFATADGSAAAGAVTSMTAAGQGIVTPAAPSRIAPMGLLPAHLPKPEIQSAATGTATCNETSCTFTNFGDDTPGSAWAIDGTISRSGDTYSFDLTYVVDFQSFAYNWAIDGAVTVTATSIDGTVHSRGETSGAQQGYDIVWDVTVDYQAIGLDGQGCPISGSIHAESSYDVSGAAGGNYDIEGTVTFGPACGQAS